MNKTKGFTLIELLIVIAIIGILAAVVLIAINPVEMMRRGRDSQRMSDMTQLRKAVDLYVTDGGDLIDASVDTTSSSGSRDSSGAGWIGLDLHNVLATLPSEPVDDADNPTTSWAADPPPLGSGMDCTFRYYFESLDASDTYELNCYLESETNADKLTADGGDDDDAFEVGTDPGLNLLTNPGGCS